MIQNFNSNLASSGTITAPSGVIDVLTTVSGAFSESLTVSGIPVQLQSGGGGSALTVKEADGSPSVANVDTIVVSNGTLTNDGGGQVTIQTGATGGGGGGGGSGVLGRDFQGAVINTTSGISIASSFQHNIGWDTVAYDTSGFYNAGQVNRLTVPVGSGIEYVQIRASISWDANSSPGFRFADLKKNGSSVSPAVSSKIANVDETSPINSTVQDLMSYPIQVADGDYFELTITQGNDASAAVSTSSARTWFSIEDVTPSSGTSGGGSSSLVVEEQGGFPTVSGVIKIKVTNATLTDEGGGVVSIDTGGTGGGGGELTTSGMWFNVHAIPEDPSPYSDWFDDNSTNPTLSGSHDIDWTKWRQWDVDAVSGTSTGKTATFFGGGNGTVAHDLNMMRITHDSSTLGGWTGVYQDAPPGSFTITTKVGIANTFQSNVDIRMGIFIADDLDGAPATSDLYSASLYHVPSAWTIDTVGGGLYSQIEGALWTDYNSISTEFTTAAAPYPGTSAWLRLNYNAATMLAETSISEDGINWKKLEDETLTFTPSHMGFGINRATVSSAVSAVFEFFAVHDSVNSRGTPMGYGRLVPVVISGSTGGGGGGGLSVAVESLTASGSALTGDVILEGVGGVSLHPSGQTVIISGSPGGGGGTSTIDSVNAITSGDIVISGTGSIEVLTVGQTITVSGIGSQGTATVSGCYGHTQSSASSSWTIPHNLGTEKVNYIVLDSLGVQVQPDIFTIDSANQVTIDFISARTGLANIFACIDDEVDFTGAVFDSIVAVTGTFTEGLTIGSSSIHLDPNRITAPQGHFTTELTVSGIPVDIGGGGGGGLSASANETITGNWDFTTSLTVSGIPVVTDTGEFVQSVIVVGSTASSIIFTLPQTATTLEIDYSTRSAGATDITSLKIQFNADTGSNYTRQTYLTTDDDTQATGYSGAVDFMVLSDIPGSTALANSFGSGHATIPHYSSSVAFKAMHANSYIFEDDANSASNKSRLMIHGGMWKNTAAVTSITIFPSVGDFEIGSMIKIRGH